MGRSSDKTRRPRRRPVAAVGAAATAALAAVLCGCAIDGANAIGTTIIAHARECVWLSVPEGRDVEGSFEVIRVGGKAVSNPVSDGLTVSVRPEFPHFLHALSFSLLFFYSLSLSPIYHFSHSPSLYFFLSLLSFPPLVFFSLLSVLSVQSKVYGCRSSCCRIRR